MLNSYSRAMKKAALLEKLKKNPGLLARLRRAMQARQSQVRGNQFVGDFQSGGDLDIERESGGRGYL